MIGKRQLLCTFSTIKLYKSTVESIRKFYTTCSGKFFVFSNDINTDEVIITYNIESDRKDFPKFPNTISIHRKKQTNTLYTLNAMNQIIKDETGGSLDKKHTINWEFYINSLIITGDPQIRILPIRILEIID
jgi:hypothetical protein